MARLEEFASNMRSLGFRVDVSDLDLRKVSRFLNGEIRKIERVRKTALKRAGSIVKRQLLGAVKGKGSGYRIAGPHDARSELHDLLHGKTGGVGAPFGIGDPRSIVVELRGEDAAVVGWKKPSLRNRVERFQFGSIARDFHGGELRHARSRYGLYRVVHARNPNLSDDYKLPEDYDQPDRPVVDPIQENAREDLPAWIEGNIRSLVKQGRAGDLAAVAMGDYLSDKEDFR